MQKLPSMRPNKTSVISLDGIRPTSGLGAVTFKDGATTIWPAATPDMITTCWPTAHLAAMESP